MEPALSIINICGGFQAVADMTGRDVSRVHRWTYTKERGGTDGLIPADAQALLLKEAVNRGIPLEPDHFFPGFCRHVVARRANQPRSVNRGKSATSGAA